jgi:hypothetical protein
MTSSFSPLVCIESLNFPVRLNGFIRNRHSFHSQQEYLCRSRLSRQVEGYQYSTLQTRGLFSFLIARRIVQYCSCTRMDADGESRSSFRLSTPASILNHPIQTGRNKNDPSLSKSLDLVSQKTPANFTVQWTLNTHKMVSKQYLNKVFKNEYIFMSL